VASEKPRNERILVVEDEEQVSRLLVRMLEPSGWSCAVALHAGEARERLAEESFALMLCDVHMPGESGLDLVRDVLAEHPDTAAVMVTAMDDPLLAEVALEFGAYGYITKPFQRNQLLISVSNALRRRSLEIENRGNRGRLEQAVRERTRELQESREETIQRLSRAVEYRDTETGGHIERMSRYCALLAERLGLDAEGVRIASPMHDVGKIGVPDRILLKPGKLTAAERRVMEEHSEIGRDLLAGSGNELLELAAMIAWTHHEKVDGSGYPRGLAGEEIPLEGRITAVADVFDALTSDRVYRAAFSLEKSLAIMREGHGTQFDPLVLDLFLDSIDDVLEIRARYPGPGEKPRPLEGVGEPDEPGG
jgi:putative two-component system response regulator